MVDCRSHIRRQKRKPVRVRRGPATVTGVDTPGSQELSPPVSSNQGVDTLSEDIPPCSAVVRGPVPAQCPIQRSADPMRADRVFAYGAATRPPRRPPARRSPPRASGRRLRPCRGRRGTGAVARPPGLGRRAHRRVRRWHHHPRRRGHFGPTTVPYGLCRPHRRRHLGRRRRDLLAREAGVIGRALEAGDIDGARARLPTSAGGTRSPSTPTGSPGPSSSPSPRTPPTRSSVPWSGAASRASRACSASGR